MYIHAEGSTCEDVTVLGPDEAPLHQGAHGDVPARGAVERRVAGAFASELVQGEGVGAIPLYHSHHEVGVATVFRCGEGMPVRPLTCAFLAWPGKTLGPVPGGLQPTP